VGGKKDGSSEGFRQPSGALPVFAGGESNGMEGGGLAAKFLEKKKEEGNRK